MLKQTKWLAVLLAAVLMLGSCAQVGGAVLAARVGMPAGAGEVAAQPEAAPGLSAPAAETHPAGMSLPENTARGRFWSSMTVR